MIRGKCFLETAANLISGDRNEQHGDAFENFDNCAALWNGYLNSVHIKLDAHDVGIMMLLSKIARTKTGSFNIDDYIDALGYGALAAQIKTRIENINPVKEGELT